MTWRRTWHPSSQSWTWIWQSSQRSWRHSWSSAELPVTPEAVSTGTRDGKAVDSLAGARKAVAPAADPYHQGELPDQQKHGGIITAPITLHCSSKYKKEYGCCFTSTIQILPKMSPVAHINQKLCREGNSRICSSRLAKFMVQIYHSSIHSFCYLPIFPQIRFSKKRTIN